MIPVENIYYLLCYAWDRLEARSQVQVSAVPGNRVENLLAKVLCDGVSQLLRTGLDRGYVAVEHDARVLRGKLLICETVKRALLPSGRVACAHDELTVDVPHNRVIKAAMGSLLRLETVDQVLRSQLRAHCQRLADVTDVELTPRAFRGIQLHSNVARYAFLINACSLVERSLLPDPKTGERRFHPFTANAQEMGLLFEAFVRNFCRYEVPEFEVSAPHIVWDAIAEIESDLGWLPVMRTDAMLSTPDRRVIIETKYYATPYQQRFGTRKLLSEHLYQLLTYLSHSAASPGPPIAGLLLYASAGDRVSVSYELGGFPVRVQTLSLAQPWERIHAELRSLVMQYRAPNQPAVSAGIGQPA